MLKQFNQKLRVTTSRVTLFTTYPPTLPNASALPFCLCVSHPCGPFRPVLSISFCRFNRTTPFLHHQPALVAGMYNPADDYHRHFNNQSQPSAMLDQSFLSDVSGQPTSLPMYHHQQQQQRMAGGTFPQHQQRATPLLLDRSYHTDSGYYQPRCFFQIDFFSFLLLQLTISKPFLMKSPALDPSNTVEQLETQIFLNRFFF